MECVPDLAFLQMAAASSNEMLSKMMWHTPTSAAAAAAAFSSSVAAASSQQNSGSQSPASQSGGGGSSMKQRKTNFTSREVEALLAAVAERKDTVLFGVAGGLGWARAWHEVAQQVSAVEGIHRSESDVRKKWTYLKWEAKNTSKPGRDPTSRAVLDILTSREGDSPTSNSLLEQLLDRTANSRRQDARGISPPVPQTSPSSTSPVPIAPKKITAPPPPPPAPQSQQQQQQAGPPPEVCLRWNSYHSNMQATFPSLLNNEQFVDVTLACEGRSIKCHKVMLSACSSYFEELLSQNPCQHPIIFMRDMKFWEVQALVEFMYSGEVNVAQEKLPSLLSAAEALQIKGLTPAGSSSSNDDDHGSMTGGETEDCPLQPQKRVRKRKSAHPLAYPVRSIQNTPPSPASNHMLPQMPPMQPIHKIKVPMMSPLPGTSHLREEPSYHPPVRIKRERSSTPPLSLSMKEEPLDLGMDLSERHKDKEDSNGPSTNNGSLLDTINRLHGKQQQAIPQGIGGQPVAESNGGGGGAVSEDDGSIGSDRSPALQIDPGEADV